MSKSYDIEDEVAHLRREIDEIKALINPNTGHTTKAQRQALRKHVEELDKAIKEKKQVQPILPEKKNTFQVGQIVDVDRLLNPPEKSRGKIQYIACRLALPKYRKEENACDRKTCKHTNKPYVWVVWPDRTMLTYHFGKLKLLTEEDLKPRIGRELSGRIGPWVYDNKKLTWKKDGDPKEYTQDEFGDIMYYEAHPNAKEEGEFMIKTIMNLGRPIKQEWKIHDESKPAPGEHEEFLQIQDEDIVEMK